ncbi:MAG TPA: sterol desaturase family protein [Caulobacteraceae bacterium]|nr:sterol desaturase family protein [Caulobacteraceae bacterium]
MSEFWRGIPAEWLGNMTTDVRRYIIFAVAVWAILYLALGWVLRNRRIRDKDAAPKQMIVEFAMSIRSIAIFSTIGLSIYILDELKLMPLPHLAQSWGPVWFWVSLATMIVAHDAYFYWVHRIMHRPRWFRSTHRRHHLSHITTPFTAYSFDLAEAALMAGFVPVWLMIFPTPFAATGLFMLHQIFRNTLLHAGYELMPARRDGRPMFDFLTTATHHNLHHMAAPYNFGLYFTFWDRMMGTENPRYYERFAAAVRKPLLIEGQAVQTA